MIGSGRSTDQDLLSIITLMEDFLPQVSFRNLQVLPHFSAVLQEGQVAVVDANQLSESTTPVSKLVASSHSGPLVKIDPQGHYIWPFNYDWSCYY